ncbi:MAG: response regulator transcription factor [Lachnospiraceae bacterium]|nr:response regulator transcription factor [Lachnospiraceae bacterium]
MTKIFLIEDDKSIVENLREFLSGEGFFVEAVSGQKEALKRLESETFDIVLLDISLADGNGFAVCAYVKQNTDTPVIFLTASGDEYSVVSGLDMGADDYISKPFRPRELVSRINSVLRRAGKAQTVLEAGGITVDTAKAVVKKNGEEIFLSALEYRILLILFNNKGMVLTRERLLEEIWDAAGEFVNDNTLTVYIKRLREKIEKDPANPEIVMTIRGMGYRVS